MEEEQARQAAAAAAAAQATGGSTSSEAAPAQAPSAPEPAAVPTEPTDDDEEAMLRQALAMSQGQDVEMHAEGDEDISEEEAIARAIEMSMKPQEDQDGKDKK